jgi:hypothetical protein
MNLYREATKAQALVPYPHIGIATNGYGPPYLFNPVIQGAAGEAEEAEN